MNSAADVGLWTSMICTAVYGLYRLLDWAEVLPGYGVVRRSRRIAGWFLLGAIIVAPVAYREGAMRFAAEKVAPIIEHVEQMAEDMAERVAAAMSGES